MNALKYITITSALALSTLNADTSWSFTVGTTTDQGNSVSASGLFTFSDTGVFSGIVTNDSVDNSTIKGFWFLDPISSDDDIMDVESFFATITGWEADNGAPSYMNPFIKNKNANEYFGAFASHINDGLTKGESASFSFQLDPATGIDPTSWTNPDSGLPTVALRWQQVGVNFGDSAKAVGELMLNNGGGGGGVTPVPEPSFIAFLGLLGLGGIVFLRFRKISGASQVGSKKKRS